MVRDNSVMLIPTAKVGDALIPNNNTDQDSGEFERAEGDNIVNQNYQFTGRLLVNSNSVEAGLAIKQNQESTAKLMANSPFNALSQQMSQK